MSYLLQKGNNMKEFDNEIPKYQKKSTRQPPKKSNHKHNYKSFLLKADNKYCLSEYCIVCGKIGKTTFMESEDIGGGLHRLLSNEEIYNKYKDLEIYEVNDLWDKYVAIERGLL